MIVKLYGGHRHGTVIAHIGSSPICMPMYQDVVPQAINEGSRFVMPEYDYETYRITKFGDGRSCPYRQRTLSIAVVDGYSLTRQERRELKLNLSAIPWEFPYASILGDFEQWWSQTLYRVTGLLEWEGRTVERGGTLPGLALFDKLAAEMLARI